MNTTFNLLSESADVFIMGISLVAVIITLAVQRTVIHEQRREIEVLRRAKRKQTLEREENRTQEPKNISDGNVSCSVISCSYDMTERTYRLKIEYNSDEYFFLVETLECDLTGGKQQITSIHRGFTHFDCGKRLKNSEKKKIRRAIEAAFS